MEEIKKTSSQENQVQVPQLTSESAAYLLKTAKWGKFLAILGFILTGLIFIAGILMSFVLSTVQDEMVPLNLPFSPKILSIIYIIIAGISVIPVIFLNSFCNQTIKAVKNSSSVNLAHSMRNLKNLFVFMGISTVVMLALYTIVLITIGTAAIISL
jgi:hypothetical protein